MNLVPATKDMVLALYDDIPKSFRGVAAVEDGKVYGIAGIVNQENCQFVFFKSTEELRKHPRIILKGWKQILKMATGTLRCECDKNLESAHRFLTHLGFAPITKEVYEWQSRY